MTLVATIAVWCFGLGVALLAYAFLGYPILTGILAKVCRRRVRKAPIEPEVTFIISAYNEEDVIEEKLHNTLELDYPREKFEIVVASDGSSDGTDDIVRRFEPDGVKLFRTEGRLGKTLTLNEAIKAAGGEIVICCDATSIYEKDAVRQLAANFADPTVGGVSGRVAFRYTDSAVAKGFRLYRSFIISQAVNESLFGHQTQLAGAIHAIRKDLFVPCPAEISTEEWNAFHIARQGKHSVYDVDAVCSEISRSHRGPEFKARVRMVLQCLPFTVYATKRGFTRHTLLYTFQNTSSKVIRWFMPLILALCLVSGTVASLAIPGWWPVAVVMWLGVLVAVLSLALPRLSAKIPGLSVLSFFALVMGAFSVALVKYVFGKQAATWEPDRLKP
jgi:hypothetical protein